MCNKIVVLPSFQCIVFFLLKRYLWQQNINNWKFLVWKSSSSDKNVSNFKWRNLDLLIVELEGLFLLNCIPYIFLDLLGCFIYISKGFVTCVIFNWCFLLLLHAFTFKIKYSFCWWLWKWFYAKLQLLLYVFLVD